IAGLLQDSFFQGELLMSEENLLAMYPKLEGYQYFLIDTKNEQPAALKTDLENALTNYGLHATLTRERLESFLAFENTYLSTLQSLGGLGLVLGSLGLAVVLLRTVLERRRELARLRAVG